MVYSVFEIAYLNENKSIVNAHKNYHAKTQKGEKSPTCNIQLTFFTLTILFHLNGEAVCTLNYTKENHQDFTKVKQFNLREAFGKGVPSQLSKT